MDVPFFLRLPMFQKDASNARTLRDVLCAKISCLAKELKGAKALVDGDLVKHSNIRSYCKKNSFSMSAFIWSGSKV